MRLTDFDYELPEELIAQTPLADRSASRLLLVGEEADQHLQFVDLLAQLRADDVLVVNDTRVLNARLTARKTTGGAAEVLLERQESDYVALCQVRASKALKPGGQLLVGKDQSIQLTLLERADAFFRLEFSQPVLEVLDKHGEMPLPPYIDAAKAEAAAPARQRYQTVYASQPGAVAAPTAGLHFNEALLEQIKSKGIKVVPITLHVGAGTFAPVRVDDLREHQMHAERYFISQSSRAALDSCQGRIVAVGTTVVRALESAAATRADQGDTDIFITPGFRYQVVDALITNFHLPKSTLLMLVAAFTGLSRMRRAYASAVAQRYRFFSYGDAMFLPHRVDPNDAVL